VLLREQFFSKNSNFLWVISTYYKRKKQYIELFKENRSNISYIRHKSSKQTDEWISQISAGM
jgi:hypothetical protein